MKRRVFTLAAGVSLVLCLATAALWVRSYMRLDSVVLRRSTITDSIWSLRGSIALSRTEHRSGGRSSHGKPEVEYHAVPAEGFVGPNAWASSFAGARTIRYAFLGFGFLRASDPLTQSNRWLWFPHWFAALLCAIIPALYLHAVLRTRRVVRLNLCPTCGYDLRATPDRCPECGNVSVAAAETDSRD